MCRFQQSLGRRLTVYRVDHDLLRGNGFDGFQPGNDIRIAGIIDTLALTFASHEHRLDDYMPLESLQTLDDELDVIGAIGMVHLIYIYRIYGIELQDIVVHLH